MKLRLLPTHSRLAKWQPDFLAFDYRLSQHQVDTYEAIREQSADVIIHTGMTGDGKSLAGQLFGLENPKHHIVAMYPTNELIRDQRRSLMNNLKKWNTSRRVFEMNADALDSHMEHEGVKRTTALEAYLQKPQILLTNPDLFNYILAGWYDHDKAHPFQVITPFLEYFHQYTFDEFHLFDQQQATAILTQMAFIRAHSPNAIFVLLSATPDPTYSDALLRAGFDIRIIEGDYLHAEGDAPDGYRTILQGVDLELIGVDDLGEWLEANVESHLLPILQQGQQRVAILFNSVFSVLQSYGKVASVLADYIVAHNTGLTPSSMKLTSLDADVVLGTSTVDVGVDLKINNLIFEAYDAASFKQRLGRLGRHAGYKDRAENEHLFNGYRAVAVIPRWVLARIQEKIQDGATIERTELFNLIDESFPASSLVPAYNRFWGWYGAYDLQQRMNAPAIRSQFETMREDAKQRMENVLDVPLGTNKWPHYKEIKSSPHLVNALNAFRGSSGLTALIVNPAYASKERFQFYDLLRVLRSADVELLDLMTILDEALAAGIAKRTIERQQPYIALRWLGVVEKSRKLKLSIERAHWDEEQFATKVMVEKGLLIRLEPSLPIGDGLQSIKRRRRVMRVVLGKSPSEVRRMCRLGMYFPLYHFEAYNNPTKGSIALGRDALLLDAALTRYRADLGGALIV